MAIRNLPRPSLKERALGFLLDHVLQASGPFERLETVARAVGPRLNERFTDVADWVSAAMGTPANIALWLLLVGAWFLIFALNPSLANSTTFLPAWFTGTAFNFPLNTVTTLAELYIGFLVAAASNRVERRNREQTARMQALEERIDTIVEGMATLLETDHAEHGRQLAELRELVTDLHTHTQCTGHTVIQGPTERVAA